MSEIPLLHVCVCESKEGFVDVFRQLDSVLRYVQNLIAFPSHKCSTPLHSASYKMLTLSLGAWKIENSEAAVHEAIGWVVSR